MLCNCYELIETKESKNVHKLLAVTVLPFNMKLIAYILKSNNTLVITTWHKHKSKCWVSAANVLISPTAQLFTESITDRTHWQGTTHTDIEEEFSFLSTSQGSKSHLSDAENLTYPLKHTIVHFYLNHL